MSSAKAASGYIRRGLAPVPIPPRRKGPDLPDWQDLRVRLEEVPRYFANGQNVGVLTGEPSGWRVDVDIDASEAAKVAGRFLAPTLTSGRERAPHSHWWYRCPGARTKKFKDVDGEMLVELRSTGCQTVVAPSVHPEGDHYLWHEGLDMAEISADELVEGCRDLAAATLIARHLPPVGGRHDFALALIGYLLRRLDTDKVLRIVHAAWDAAGGADREAHRDLDGIVRDTAEKLAGGEHVSGGPSLEEVAAGVPRLLAKWFGWAPTTVVEVVGGDVPPSANGNATRGQGQPTHDELRDRYIAANGDFSYGLGEWRGYGRGVWPPVPELTIKRGICETIEAAKPEGTKPTNALLTSVTELTRVRVAVPDEAWDADPDILVCTNGALRISTRELEPHRREHYATSAVPYDYDPTAVPVIWNYFLKNAVPAARNFLQEFAGYALTTEMGHELAVWLFGPPASGKSTFLAGLQAMLGHRAGVLGLAEIERNRFALAGLPGKTLVAASEQPSSYLASTNVLNAIISGEPLQVERKYRDPVTVLPRCKIAWAMNELPRVGDANSGLFRRVKVVKFPQVPANERDPQVKQAIEGEGAGILNWALEGLTRLQRRGGFDVPDGVEEATAQFRETNDVPALFVADRCVKDPDASEKAGTLYGEYRDWCEDNGHRPQSSTRLADDWQRLGFERYRSKGTTRYRGIRLRMAADE